MAYKGTIRFPATPVRGSFYSLFYRSLMEKICMAATFFNKASDTPALTRRLDDDVLQSAEEAVLTNPNSSAVLQGHTDPQAVNDVKAGSTESPPVYQRALARQVAQQPFTAALIAFGAGALLISIMRSVISRRRDRS
ncbi:MAG: hypothetical protein H7238_01400 [Polaromonas sp.]|nr:hypothetical protein [Polaromonas sp.]